eukprot:jgi/Undpi1/8510/HiC_scaffold_25.g10977.m1
MRESHVLPSTNQHRPVFYRSSGASTGSPSIRGGKADGFRVQAAFKSQGSGPDAPVVAYAISLTSLELPKALSVLDAAEVLMRSIRNTCAFSAYGCETVAFVLPSINEEGKRLVEGMGWRIIVKDLPVAVEDIENKMYREHVVNSGCCGANEFIKLHAYTLTEYHRVVHLDVDTLLLHPLDRLMESDASLLYTTDPAMALAGQKVFPIQGGFLLVRPDLTVYENLQAIVRKGDWKKGRGWSNSKIGWFYGGATIQGLLPYYYNVFGKGTAIEVDRCVYNHMSDTHDCSSGHYSATIPLGATAQDTEQDTTSASRDAVAIRSVHFTQSCPKPWLCVRVPPGVGPCKSLQNAWLEGRREILADKGVPFSEACNRGKYSPIPRNRV